MCNVTLFRNTKINIPSSNILFTQLAKTNDTYVETHASLMLGNKITRSDLRSCVKVPIVIFSVAKFAVELQETYSADTVLQLRQQKVAIK